MLAFRKSMAAALIAAAITLPTALAAAAETAPLAPAAQQEAAQETSYGKADAFTKKRSYLGVTSSTAWMQQARVGGLLLNLRLFTPMGDSIAFEECLGAAATGGEKDIRLTMRVLEWQEGTMLQLDQYAAEVLDRVGVTEIALADGERNIHAIYNVDEILSIRSMFGLGAAEQLSLAGEHAPVTVVSEDGIRRQLTK